MNEHDVHVPRNPQEAIAQANRLQRAERLLQEGYTFCYDAELETVFVTKPGELHAAYTIGPQVDGTNGCDCPDKAKGNICKHEIAWALIQKQEADEAANWEAQCKEYDETEAWADIPNERLHRMRNLFLAELLDAENKAARLQHEPFANKDAAYSWLRKADRCRKVLAQFDETLHKVELGLLTL